MGKYLQQYQHPTGDVVALGSIAAVALDYAPKVAAVLAIAWYLFLFGRATVAFVRKLLKR